MKKIVSFCHTVRTGFVTGLLTGGILLMNPPGELMYGWSVNWGMIGWLTLCAVGLILSFFHKETSC